MSGGNSVYSPLPQSNSDTDESSEEELHSSNESRIINKLSSAPIQESILNGQKQNSSNYKPLNDNVNAGIMLNGFQTIMDEVSILSPNENSNKMSAARKICFLFSLFLCAFTIIIFLWVLPCDTSSCPSGITTWEQTFDNIELYGPINVVPAAFGKKQNLVLLFRNVTEKGYKPSSDQGGIISLLGNNGELAWFVKLKRRPTDMDCNLIDVNLDGLNDCLVIGDDDMLKAIHSISGTEIWDVQGPDNKKDLSMYHFKFPLILPDLNGDGVEELLTACSSLRNSTWKRQNHLVIISGKSGTAVADPVEIKTCFALNNFVLEKDYNITYTCIDSSGKESVRTTNLPDICKTMKCPFDQFLRKGSPKNNQHKTDLAVRNIFEVDRRRLLLENKGTCPDCNVSVSVKDEREKINTTVYSFESTNAYGMMPVTISSGKIKGFIVKFWQWHLDKEDRNVLEKDLLFRPQTERKGPDFQAGGRRFKTSYENLDREMMSDASSLPKRFKRSGNGFRYKKQTDDPRIVYRLSERVVLITFNKTDSRFVNASHFNITQLCENSETCQPDMRSQAKSLFLTDLDQDGFQELISYTTTWIDKETCGFGDKPCPAGEQPEKTWQLVSKIRVVRLESELPKLYDNLTRP